MKKVLEKIKKCLAVAQGANANENEAAIALRQAQALMREHGVSELDVLTADVSTCDMRSRAKQAPAQWEMTLMNRIAHAFDCELAFHRGFEGRWVFIGVGDAAEVAQYTAAVMLRQALKARDAYSAKKLSRVTVRENKVRRADLFCTGWVSVATSLVVGAGRPTHPALLAYMDAEYGKASSITGKDRNGSRSLREYEYRDYAAGQAAGHGVQLHRGLGSADKPLMLG